MSDEKSRYAGQQSEHPQAVNTQRPVPIVMILAVVRWIVRVFRTGTIRTRLIVAFAAMVLLPTAAVTIASVVVGIQSGSQQVIQQLELKAAFKEEEVNAWVDNMQANLTAALESINVRRVRDLFEVPESGTVHQVLRSHWSGYIAQTQQFEELFLLDLQGRPIVSTEDARMDTLHSEQPYFQEGLRAPCVHLLYSSSSGRLLAAVAQPLIDEEQTLGVLVGYTSVDTLDEITREWTGMSETGKMYLVGSDHVLRTDSLSGGDEILQVRTWAADAGIESHAIGTGTYRDYRGVSVVGAFRWLPRLQAVLLVEQDQSEALRSIYTLLIINVGLALVSVILAMVASLFVTRSIVSPLGDLAGVASRIADGDLELADHVAGAAREDEVGAMAQAFSRMATRLRELLQDEQEQRERLESVVQEYVAHMGRVEAGDLNLRLDLDGDGHGEHGDPLLVLGHSINRMTVAMQDILRRIRSAVNDLGSASAEILAATTQQVSGTSEQSAAIAQTTTTVDEVRTIAEQSVARAQEVAGVSQRTVEVSRAGQRAVEETVGSMWEIRGRVEGIAENILALSEQTQQVGEIIATVNDIAAQSNILALNASVEAARAGEYGKGFAVVAVEVRNLAEQSRQATAQVRAILSDIQKATNATVMVTEEGTKQVEEGMVLASQAGESIEQLAGVIEESAQAAAQMAAGGRQQLAGVEQLGVAMQSINQATVQSLESTHQAETAARELNDLACGLTEIVERYQL